MAIAEGCLKVISPCIETKRARASEAGRVALRCKYSLSWNAGT